MPIPTLNPVASHRPSCSRIGPSMGSPSGVQHIGPLLTTFMPASPKLGMRSISRSRCGMMRSSSGGKRSSLNSFGMPSNAQNFGQGMQAANYQNKFQNILTQIKNRGARQRWGGNAMTTRPG